MGPRFDETKRGVKFFDRDLPNLIKAIQENTAELKRANDLKEAERIERERLVKGCWNEPKDKEQNENPYDIRNWDCFKLGIFKEGANNGNS